MTNTIVSELPPELIKQLMKIAEKCVIKSNKISQDETQDFVQNCLLKLLMQIEQERVVCDMSKNQYFVMRQNGQPLEIERWFGTTAANISIDRYRRIKKQIDAPEIMEQATPYHEEAAPTLLAPEPSANLEEEFQQEAINAMALYCSEALDDCMQETWDLFTQESYKNFTLSFTQDAPVKDKAVAVANYCQLLMEEKYSNDGKKANSHNAVCEALGMIINPENIIHKKKKFEKIMLNCVTEKVDKKFHSTTKQTLRKEA